MATEADYPDDQIRTGERYMESPITGNTYLVTKWVEKQDGRAIAIEKEPVGQEVSDRAE